MTFEAPIENRLTPFMLEAGHVRGRIVRMGEVSNTILARYDYPLPVVKLLGELIVMAGMLSSNLKQEGIFTIQIRGNGLIPLIVVDSVFGGAIRGYAEVSPEASAAIAKLVDPTPKALVGQEGYLAITLDPGASMQRYQGIVALEGDSIAEALTSYFTHSEQLDVQVQFAVSDHAPWIAAGLMIERLPETSATASEENLEVWRYGQAIASTVKREELLDPLLDAPALLYRLFHEEGVRVYPAHPLTLGCRCSRERICQMLLGMSVTDRADMIVDGAASVHCQFCNKTERFTPGELGLSVN